MGGVVRDATGILCLYLNGNADCRILYRISCQIDLSMYE